jgi:DNA invertase Pin-like site-specific DNA recombinase
MSAAIAIGYLRVSTSEQGRSGLGLQAQRTDVEKFAAREGLAIKALHQDIQTGAGKDALHLRPGLAQALKEAKVARCPLIVSRLDRLSRNVHFITGLMENRVHFMVAALGKDCDDFTLHIYASLAEQERKMISERVTVAIAASKLRGGKWGTHGRSKAWRRRFQATGVAALQKAADERAEAYRFHIEWVLHQPGRFGGPISFWEAANKLNERNIHGPMGGKWVGKQVHRMAIRLKLDHPQYSRDEFARKIIQSLLITNPNYTADEVRRSPKFGRQLGLKRATRLVREHRLALAKQSSVQRRIAWPIDHWTDYRIRIARILHRSPKLFAWQVAEQLGPDFRARIDWVRKTMRDYRVGTYKRRQRVNQYWNRKRRDRMSKSRGV